MTSVSTFDRMVRLVAALYVWALALASTQANAQAGATPPPASPPEAALQPTLGAEQPAPAPNFGGDVCRALEQAAEENGLPVDFFVRVPIWPDSRFPCDSVPSGRSGYCTFSRAPPIDALSYPFDILRP